MDKLLMIKIVTTATTIIVIIIKTWYSLPISDRYCQYLSMHFLVSKVLTLMVVKAFKMTSPKGACILFQTLTALIVIDFFLYKFVQNEGLKSFPVEETKCKPIVEHWW